MKRQGRATPEHKKHNVFPGFRAGPDVKIENNLIRPLHKRHSETSPVSSKSKAAGSDWERYDAALALVRDTGKNASSAALQIRNGFEFNYYLASRYLIKEGKLPQIRRKYRLR